MGRKFGRSQRSSSPSSLTSTLGDFKKATRCKAKAKHSKAKAKDLGFKAEP